MVVWLCDLAIDLDSRVASSTLRVDVIDGKLESIRGAADSSRARLSLLDRVAWRQSELADQITVLERHIGGLVLRLDEEVERRASERERCAGIFCQAVDGAE